jgi:hypothetical protein
MSHRESHASPGESRGHAPDPGGSLMPLLNALTRLARYGSELLALEARTLQRAAGHMVRLQAAACLCLASAWLMLNAGLVVMASAHLQVEPWLALIAASIVNALLAVVLYARQQHHRRELARSSLLSALMRL